MQVDGFLEAVARRMAGYIERADTLPGLRNANPSAARVEQVRRLR